MRLQTKARNEMRFEFSSSARILTRATALRRGWSVHALDQNWFTHTKFVHSLVSILACNTKTKQLDTRQHNSLIDADCYPHAQFAYSCGIDSLTRYSFTHAQLRSFTLCLFTRTRFTHAKHKNAELIQSRGICLFTRQQSVH